MHIKPFLNISPSKSLKMSFLLVLLFPCRVLFSQRNVKDSTIATPLVGVQYGFNQPAYDLASRYGYFNYIGILAGYKTKHNLFWGVDANFMFGNQIKAKGLFDNLIDSYGRITDVNGNTAIVMVYARGFHVNAALGKIIPVFSPNKNSGLFIHGGIGYILHHLRIETQDQVVPLLELDYKKGYDRLTAGVNFHEFIGYSFMSNGGFFNFYAGFYFQQGFTKNQRTLFFDQPQVPVPTNTRKDFLYGLRVGWYIPFYKRQPKEFYYN
jgi:hypothetical protein